MLTGARRAPGNAENTTTAPVTVIVACELLFFEALLRRFPHTPAMRARFAENPRLIEVTARRHSSLQGAYLMLAARALGLDCGPLSGFDNAKLDEAFFGARRDAGGGDQESRPERHLRSNVLGSLGYADREALTPRLPRLPRLPFDDACRIA